MLAHISANTLIWWAAFGPAIVLSLIAFTAQHVLDVLSRSLGEEA